VQLVGLTRNVQVSGGKLPVPLVEHLPEPSSSSDVQRARVWMDAKFQPGPGETQMAACSFWFGDWDEARAGLRRLLPVNMFTQNEGLLWRKRNSFTLEYRVPDRLAASQWESSWDLAEARALPWRSGDGPWRVPPGGLETFARGVVHDARLAACLSAVLSFADAGLAARLLGDGTAHCQQRIERFVHSDEDAGAFLEGLLWTMWALGLHLSVSGVGDDGDWLESAGAFLRDAADVLGRSDLYGVNGGLLSRYADGSSLTKQVIGRDVRDTEHLESVRSTAMMVVALETAVAQFMRHHPLDCARLEELARRKREFLEGLFEGTFFPRWLLRDKKLGRSQMFLDHHVWLLLMGLPDSMAEPVTDAVAARLAAGAMAGIPEHESGDSVVLDQPNEILVDGTPSTDRIDTALLIWGLGRQRPEAARDLFNQSGSLGWRRAYPWNWNLFQQGPVRVPWSGGMSRRPEEMGEADRPPSLVSGASGVAGMVGRLGVLGLRTMEGALELRTELLDAFSLSSPTLTVGAHGSRISGQWTGLDDSRRIWLVFGSEEEALGWSCPGCDQAVREGNRWGLTARSGERWSLEKE